MSNKFYTIFILLLITIVFITRKLRIYDSLKFQKISRVFLFDFRYRSL